MKKTRVVLSVWGRFHMFHLARQLERFGYLEKIISTYPKFRLKNEKIPAGKLITNSWLHGPLLAKWRYGIYHRRLDRLWGRLMDADQIRFIARHLPECDVLVAHSGSGALAGPIVQSRGGRWICERSSSHQLYADRLLSEEHARYGSVFQVAEPWALDKELREYEQADLIVVPSEYARRSFISMGIASEKIAKIPFGADLTYCKRSGVPDPNTFTVFFCGQVSFRKGIPYLLDAFRRVNHPRKKLIIAGGITPEIKPFLATSKLDNVEFTGLVDRVRLATLYSQAHVFAIASIDEGLALVQAEAMAFGMPVVGTDHSGGSDVIREGVDGYVVPIRDPAIFAERLQRFADDPNLSRTMGASAFERIQSFGGWDQYGEVYKNVIDKLIASPPMASRN